MVSLSIDSVQIERADPLRSWEISVFFDKGEEEGSYTFLISDVEWAAAVKRGNGLTGREAVNKPWPWLLVGKKEAVRG